MVSNVYINEMLKNVPTFRGVFSCDNIQHDDSFDRYTYIINLSRQGELGSHFVALSINNETEKVFYFDSFGLPCQNAYILKFMSGFAGKYEFNCQTIQNPLSVYCGFYCMYYVLASDLSYSFRKMMKPFIPSPSMGNDYICINEIIKLASLKR